ncbi:MAG: ATP-binding protein [Nitrococcus sp.]|nr:ATP-binding protein [Nitrococcus sp.]
MSTVLERIAFETSRELEYFTEKELRQQIGYAPAFWPVAILRELVDNALDACEANGVLPEIEVTIADDEMTVADNGHGIPPATLVKSLDYLIRVSDKAHYVSPTRGAMGNALKVIWAAPFVATGAGNAEIVTRGEKYCIHVTLDRIEQRPRMEHTVKPAIVKNGTSFSIRWTNSTRQLTHPENAHFLQVLTVEELITGYAAFNPHATFIVNGERIERTFGEWRKWMPGDPIPAHWYSEETLRDLIAAYVAAERNGGPARTVREFVSEFRGLSATATQKAVTREWSRSYLHDFVADGDLEPEFVEKLLERMTAASKAPKPQALGVLGKDHLTAWMVRNGVAEESIRYKRSAGEDAGLPYVLEVVFGINENVDSTRRIVTGLNWSPTIGGDPDPTLRQCVAEARLDPHDPVTYLVHIARPRFDFADRGKTRLV